MPDDPLEIAEQEEDAAFALEAEGAEAEKEPEKEPEGEPEKEPEKEPEGEPEKEPEKEPTLEEKIAARGEELGVDAEPEKEEPAEPKVEVEEELKEAIKDGKLTKEEIANYLGGISDEVFPDGSIIIGDEEINLKEFAEDFPDQWAAVKVLSNVIAQKAVQDKLKDSNLVGQEAFDKQAALVDSLLWWDEVRETHPDAKKVAGSDEFDKWLGGQSKAVQRMAAEGAEPSDAILVLDYYKEGIAKEKVKAHDEEAARKKKEKDDLHGNTMREKTSTATETDQDLLDEDAAFEAEANRP